MRTVGIIALCALVGCTTNTVIERQAAGTDPAPDDGTSAPNDGSGSGSGTTPGDDDPNAPPSPLVKGLNVKDVAVYQAVKVPVVQDGKAVASGSRNAPVVAGRPALVRVFVQPDASFAARSVTAELHLASKSSRFPVLKDTKTISGASSDADIGSTFDFEVPASSLTPDVTFSVALTAKDGDVPTGSSPARFPQDGTQAALGAEASNKVKIVVVPVRYDADGTGRLPDTSAAQIALYKQTVMAMYPATDIEITVHAPFQWSTAIAANGSGFSTVLRAVTQLRYDDQAPYDVYYYGALAPSRSMDSFCPGGCVTGLSTVVEDPQTDYLRASVGIGFTGSDAATTLAHEVGHAHGRAHSPCGGAADPDPKFPYDGGTIGTWGYDLFAKTLLSPTKGHDLMGYCPNSWVSDYTYAALFDRINAVSVATTKQSADWSRPSSSYGTFRVAGVEADGTVSFDGTREIALDHAPTGGLPVNGAPGARFYPYDHLPGGVVVMPKAAPITTMSKLQVTSFSATIAR